VLHPSAEKLNPPGGVGEGGPREYTHTHMGIHDDISRKGKKRSVTRPTSWVGSPTQTGCCLSKCKIKNGLRKILTETTSLENLKMAQWVNHDCS
jgi:hypothetical protein